MSQFTTPIITLIGLLALSAGAGLAENRTYDGSGNNLANPTWGAAGSRFARVAAAAYGDGIAEPMSDLPRADRVSDVVSVQRDRFPARHQLSGHVYQFGQFLNHDLQHSESGREPFLIPGILPIFRTRHDELSGTSPENPREQRNLNSHFLDGSAVYGSDETRATPLREPGDVPGARLLTNEHNLLPASRTFSFGARPENATGGVPGVDDGALFTAGDVRANENPGLAAIHTLFLREHNYWVDQLENEHPSWSQEELYQRARKIVGAELQAITYEEFLPSLVGPDALPQYEGYDPAVNPSIINEFATAFLRVGHSMNPPTFRRIQDNGSPAVGDPVFLESTPFVAYNFLTSSADLDYHLKGLALSRQEEVDVFVVNGLRDDGIFDLMAIDIQRGRDHGLPDYNTMREAYGLPRVTTFSEITSSAEVQTRLESAYGNVDLIDPIVGALAEDHLPGANLGSLAVAGFVEQFRRLRNGDRFWYENDPAFGPDEIEAIRGTTLANVILRNTAITNLQPNVFYIPKEGDFNADGKISLIDLDAMCGPDLRRDERFDLNGDGRARPDDVPVLLSMLSAIPGDADLNGQVDFADFLALSSNFDSRNAVWSMGNFNCDRRLDFDDFLVLSTHFGESATNMAASVPEPPSMSIVACVLGCGWARRRQRGRVKPIT